MIILLITTGWSASRTTAPGRRLWLYPPSTCIGCSTTWLIATLPLQVGDRVIGFADYGAWSEVVAVPSQYVYRMPDNMSFQDGAALPMSYLSAYIMLYDMGNLRRGQSVFAHSIGGGVVCFCHCRKGIFLAERCYSNLNWQLPFPEYTSEVKFIQPLLSKTPSRFNI